MKATLTVDKVTLDYTKIAEPLGINDVHKDILEVRERYHSVDEIVMWEHQWDWLTKPFRNEKEPIWMNLWPVDGRLRFQQNMLLGIPVRLA